MTRRQDLSRFQPRSTVSDTSARTGTATTGATSYLSSDAGSFNSAGTASETSMASTGISYFQSMLSTAGSQVGALRGMVGGMFATPAPGEEEFLAVPVSKESDYARGDGIYGNLADRLISHGTVACYVREGPPEKPGDAMVMPAETEPSRRAAFRKLWARHGENWRCSYTLIMQPRLEDAEEYRRVLVEHYSLTYRAPDENPQIREHLEGLSPHEVLLLFKPKRMGSGITGPVDTVINQMSHSLASAVGVV